MPRKRWPRDELGKPSMPIMRTAWSIWPTGGSKTGLLSEPLGFARSRVMSGRTSRAWQDGGQGAHSGALRNPVGRQTFGNDL